MSAGIFTSLENNFYGSLEEARYLQSKLTKWESDLGNYKEQADKWVDDNILTLNSKLNLSPLSDYLNHSETYTKIKDQDLSWLFGLSAVEDENVIKDTIDKVDDFLKQLNLVNLKDHLSLYTDDLNHALQLKEELEEEEEKMESANAIYQAFKNSNLPNDAKQFATSMNVPSDSLDNVFKSFESTIKKAEDPLQNLKEELDIDSIKATLVALAGKFVPQNFPISKTGVENFLNFTTPKIKSVNLAQPTHLVARDIVKVLAEISDEFLAKDPNFSKLNTIIQNLNKQLSIILENQLWDKIKLRNLAEGESILPASTYSFVLKPEPIQYKGATVNQKVSSSPPEKNGVNPGPSPTQNPVPVDSKPNPGAQPNQAAAEINIDFSEVIEGIFNSGLELMFPKLQDFYNGIISGTEFAKLEPGLEALISNFEDKIGQAIPDFEALMANSTLSLKSIIDFLFEQVKNLITALLSGIEALVKNIIEFASKAAKLIIKLILSIHLPPQLENSFPSFTEISLPCLLIAVPWVIVKNL